MRRRAVITAGLVLAMGVVSIGPCGCAETSTASASGAAGAEAAQAKPRRNRLCSGDALGEEILRSDPSLSAAGSVGDTATAAAVGE